MVDNQLHAPPSYYATSTLRVEGTINRLWRAVSKQCSFGDQIHWFLVRGAGRLVYKMYAVSEISILEWM